MSHNFGPYRDYFSGHGSVYSFFFFEWVFTEVQVGFFFNATKFRKIAYCDPIKFQSHIHSKREETWRGLELQFQLYKWGNSARFRLFNYLSPGRFPYNTANNFREDNLPAWNLVPKNTFCFVGQKMFVHVLFKKFGRGKYFQTIMRQRENKLELLCC